MNQTEIWKDVVGYEGVYMVSNWGRVRSLDHVRVAKLGSFAKHKGKILNAQTTKCGYMAIGLRLNNKNKTCSVHRIVASAFIPNNKNKPQVNHKDGNKKNNKIENLEWNTRLENISHAKEHKLYAFGERHGRSILTRLEVIEIKKLLSVGDMCQGDIGVIFRVCRKTINNIAINKTWKHVVV